MVGRVQYELNQTEPTGSERETAMSRAILIPALVGNEITVVDLDLHDFGALARAIGAQQVEFVRIADPHHYLVVDEMGLFDREARLNTRASLLYPAPIVNDVLIVGWNQDINPLDEHAMEIQGTDLPLDLVPAWLAENRL